MPQDHQHRQQPKVDRRHHKDIRDANTGRMVAEKCLPGLARSSWLTLDHVLGHSRLRDLDPELQQFTMYAGCTPTAGWPGSSAESTGGSPPELLAAHPESATSSANTDESLSDATG